MGDIGNYLELKIHANMLFSLGLIMSITSQFIYYYNYKRGIKPTFVRVFQMMSGLVTPSSVGLYRETDITRLLRHKFVYNIIKINNNYFIPLSSLLIPLATFIYFDNLT